MRSPSGPAGQFSQTLEQRATLTPVARQLFVTGLSIPAIVSRVQTVLVVVGDPTLLQTALGCGQKEITCVIVDLEFEAAWRKFEPLIRAICWRRGVPELEMQDIGQEVALRIFRMILVGHIIRNWQGVFAWRTIKEIANRFPGALSQWLAYSS